MVKTANRLLAEVAGRDEAREAAALLDAIVAQDVEIDDDTGEPRIRRGVAKDRIVSASDPEMRHGRKSSSRRYDGHKMHVVEEESSEIILGVDVGPGNGGDGERAAPLVEEVHDATGVEIDELVGDMAYSDGDTRQAVEDTGAKMVAKVQPAHNAHGYPKTDFAIDLDTLSATCPAGETSTKVRNTRDHKNRPTLLLVFDTDACASCPCRSECVTGQGARAITLSVHEARLQKARTEQLRPAVRKKLRRRAVIERKIDHLHDLGAKKARYRGRRKTKLQIVLAATVANFGRLDALGGLGGDDGVAARRKSHLEVLLQPFRWRHRGKGRLPAALKAFFRPNRWDLQRTLQAFSDPLSCSLT